MDLDEDGWSQFRLIASLKDMRDEPIKTGARVGVRFKGRVPALCAIISTRALLEAKLSGAVSAPRAAHSQP